MVGAAMSAREEILARIRAALGEDPRPTPSELGSPTALTRPTPSDLGEQARATDVVALFADRLVDYKATVRQCAPVELPATIDEALAATAVVVVPEDVPGDWLSAYHREARPESPAAPLSVAELDAAGVTVLTGCAVAIAETGTIILDAGPGQGRRALTLVPDHHVCVVRADQIAASVPAGLARLTEPTRPLTLISGPSATSDIELNRVEGVHGPRRLDVIIVG
jgi:L-lactate dehydrogenase complex protein LldG